ncbi:SirB2 family protein [[Haemophilus] ducreyi]|uniref:SirB2 family protein n=1 Tax=Haemophilus ducreyi TaxID=730 RepID=UPI000655182D|nr:SirB2 family protein [[Haemophilus] ducreyi]AKO35481.1 invasion protein expression up-regulator SirB [[Haemophilus] ducreyi]
MEFFSQLLLTHLGFAYLSLTLLLSRGVLAAKKVNWRQYKILKIAPHIIDSLLLSTGILKIAPHIIDSLLLSTGIIILYVLLSNEIYAFNQLQWLLPKMTFMVLYIIFSAKTFKKSQPFSFKHFVLAVISFMLMMIVATMH